MVVKSKSTKSQTHTAIAEPPAPLEETVAHEEKRPSVTQVVEVVEEEVQPPPPVPPTSYAPSVEEPIVAQPTVQEEEKRKEVVDEIFQKSSPTPSVMPEISMHTKRRSTPIYLWAIGTIVACVVIGVALLFATGKSGNLPSVVVIPTPTATPASEVSPTPASASGEVKRSAITIQVLNGGGKAGAATKMKKLLEDKGYTVGDTGNADSYSYDKTVIQVKASQKAYISLLEGDLKDSYTLGPSTATLAAGLSYDARVIVGKE